MGIMGLALPWEHKIPPAPCARERRVEPFRNGKAPVADSAFLKSKALNEVQQAEDTYVQAIHKLAAEARPQMESRDSALLANYREKLLVLDSAIDDLRAQADQNPSNAHLRYELLAMYREKQRTLEEILEARQP